MLRLCLPLFALAMLVGCSTSAVVCLREGNACNEILAVPIPTGTQLRLIVLRRADGTVQHATLAPERIHALTPDPTRLATTHDHGVIVWDTATMQPTQAFNIAWDGTVSTWTP